MSYIYAILLAVAIAAHDYTLIRSHIGIDHGWRLWLSRALAYGLPVTFVAMAFHVHLLTIALWLIGGGALFATFHRLLLNHWRGLKPTYMSDSNGYDRLFLHLFGLRAGIAAYITEAIIFTTSCAL